MKTRVNARLRQIELEKDVRIFYACESGSRAWGFPSLDSDYDVRFLYIHRRDWYLSINLESKRDVIECPVAYDLDVSGWELRKALKLLRKGNPPLVEWLGSPIIYRERMGVANLMRALAFMYYSPIAASYHYLHMAKGNYRVYLKGSTVWVKKYFYVLRPLLAIRWIEAGLGIVPMEFLKLVDLAIDSPELQEEILTLVAAKREGEELKWGARVEPINDFIKAEMMRHERSHFEYKHKRYRGPIAEFDQIFRTALDDAWRDDAI